MPSNVSLSRDTWLRGCKLCLVDDALCARIAAEKMGLPGGDQ